MPTSRTASPRRARKLIALGSTLLLVAAMATPARAEVVAPRLKLIDPSTAVKLVKYGKHRVPLDLGVLVGSLDAPFEVLIKRPDYLQPIQAFNVLKGDGGGPDVMQPLDNELLDDWAGLDDFLEVTVTDDKGATALEKHVTFCPNGYERQRIDDSGPARSEFPAGCFGNPFTKGMVWGIDQGWAVGAIGYETPFARIDAGKYHAVVRIAEPYATLFDVDPADASVDLDVTVKQARGRGGCYKGCEFDVRTGHLHGTRRAVRAPLMTDPDPAILPDLIPLPSSGITIENRRTGKSYIDFGATVWNGGASDMIVEGFRRPEQAIMDGYQYFYDGDEVLGRARVGELEYDPRRGHQHWHFKQFAGYSLLDAGGAEVRLSRKEAFCLAPTDALDLTLPGVNLDPALGLSTACGGVNSIWTRETLPLGWGDTYFQGLPGQSFNITDLPNGHYYIQVEANPTHALFEQTFDNNVEVREIILKGKAGDRSVEVPPWNGIDTETDQHGHGGGKFD